MDSAATAKRRGGGMLAAAMAWFTLGTTPLIAQTPQARMLDGLAGAAERAELPAGWMARSVGEAPRAHSVVRSDEGGPYLALEADAAALQLYAILDRPLEPSAGRLGWSWRVSRGVPGAELTDPSRDDAPIRVFAVFGERGLLSRPRTLFYSWGGDEPSARAFRSHVSDRIGVVVLRAGDGLVGRWVEEGRDLVRDYRAVFGEGPTEAVTAVGVMIDTDQTGASAASSLRSLRWLPPSGGLSLLSPPSPRPGSPRR